MISKSNKNKIRQGRHLSVRKKVEGTTKCPRLNVYRSTGHIYAQIIDDSKGKTIVSASSIQKEIAKQAEGKTKQETAFIVGQTIGKLAKAKKIKNVVFDRGGYLYTGRVKSLADGARDAGLEF